MLYLPELARGELNFCSLLTNHVNKIISYCVLGTGLYWPPTVNSALNICLSPGLQLNIY